MINNTNNSIRYTSFKFFLENGYEATNIRDICKEVEIKPSSLYFYYKSKQELFSCIYDDIWSEKINYMQKIIELHKNSNPKDKLYYLFKGMMEYYTKDIVKYKFLLRYHLFPAKEIEILIKDKFIFWTKKENELLLNIINQCLEKNILDDNREAYDYLQSYKSFNNSQITQMAVYNIKKKSMDMDKLWDMFWHCDMSKFNILDSVI
jgi:AcrR family transcriptional regulator